jgi:hypothetical protein
MPDVAERVAEQVASDNNNSEVFSGVEDIRNGLQKLAPILRGNANGDEKLSLIEYGFPFFNDYFSMR